MRVKILSLLAAVALVAACESAGPAGGDASGAKNIVPGSAEDLRVNVGDRVFFGYDRYDLTPEAQATLERQVKWLKQYSSVKVTIEGHCDERGTREYNLALGARRAEAVKRFLAAKGVEKVRVNVISYGKERPEAMGSGEAVWQQNRRGVTAVN